MFAKNIMKNMIEVCTDKLGNQNLWNQNISYMDVYIVINHVNFHGDKDKQEKQYDT